jgi:hypothetical protein
MLENVKLIYDLIQKDLKAKGWDDEAIAEAIAESQRERQTTCADDKTICVKEMSYLSQESLQIVTKQLNRKSVAERIKPIGSKIGAGFKALMPYMSLIAVVLCLINIIYLAKIQSDISDLQYSIGHIDTSYDNSDVINAVEEAERNIINTVECAEGDIIGSVEDAESEIKSHIIIWGH